MDGHWKKTGAWHFFDFFGGCGFGLRRGSGFILWGDICCCDYTSSKSNSTILVKGLLSSS